MTGSRVSQHRTSGSGGGGTRTRGRCGQPRHPGPVPGVAAGPESRIPLCRTRSRPFFLPSFKPDDIGAAVYRVQCQSGEGAKARKFVDVAEGRSLQHGATLPMPQNRVNFQRAFDPALQRVIPVSMYNKLRRAKTIMELWHEKTRFDSSTHRKT